MPETMEVNKKPSPLSGTTASPVIVDLGKVKRGQVKDLRKGEGKLTSRVLALVDDLRNEGTINGTAQPVIFIVGKKKRRSNLLSRFI